MTNKDRPQFVAMLTRVAEMYGKPMSPELIALYFDGLKHLTLDQVRIALNAHVRSTEVGQFMPKIADLIRALNGTAEEAAYAALAQVNARLQGGGNTTALDPLTLAVVRDMGGWRALGMRETAEWQSFGAKDFLTRYRILKSREERSQHALEDLPELLADRMNP